MSVRSYAYLDLAALPAVGSALLAARPTFVWLADGRQIVWANGAGAQFLNAPSMAALLERRFSETLPSTGQIVRLARGLPLGVTRLERITIATGGRLQNLAASCARLTLPDGASAVLIAFDPPRGDRSTVAERAASLARMIAAEDCVVAVLDRAGGIMAVEGDLDDEEAAGAVIDELIAAVDRTPGKVIKRAIRIGFERRPAGLLRFDAEGGPYHLLIAGPAERIVAEPPIRPEPAAEPSIVEAVPAVAEESVAAPIPQTSAPVVAVPPVEPGDTVEPTMTLEPETAALAPAAVPDEAPAEASAALPEIEEPEAVAAPEPVVTPPPTPEPAATVADAPAAALPADEPPVAAAPARSFEFQPPAGPVRFVFQMDAEGIVTFVSPDFAAVVGPQAADLVGRDWHEIAAARGLDGNGAIAALIRRRDTWSGVTLDWPIDDRVERIAVDLAALPAFSRDRAFEGYRGFGVIRPIDTRREPPPVRERPVVVSLPPPRPIEPSNVVRLPRSPAASEGERLSGPEQDAFRRIAAALGAETPAAPPPENPAVIAPEPTKPIDVKTSELEAPEPPLAARADPSLTQEAEPPPVAAPEPAEAQPAPTMPPLSPMVSDLLLERFAEAGRKIAELEAILDTATDGVAVVDSEGRIERINKSAEALFGVATREVTGLLFTDLLADESRKSALDYLEGLARNGVASVLNDGREVIGRVPQGGLIPLFMTMGRVGETGKFCAVLRDITQWKNAEEELVNARRTAETASMQKSDFLAKISHEIRTPLNAIIGFSEVMMEERFGPIGTERYKEYLRDIHVSGAHLMSLLNDLLDLSKIEAGKLDLAFEAVALNDIVMECVALMQPQANRERIIIRTSLSSQVPNIIADSRSIRQIALNLLSNAVKFTLAGGQVIVSTALEERGEVTLRIRDTGIGMSERDIETALKPFRQLTTSPKSRNDGTGLGLPLTKALVEANRAAFVIDSEVGQGTLIRITFPTTRVLAG